MFVATNICHTFCHDKNMFVRTKVLSWQAYFCRDKRRVLSPQTHVCHDKHVFVVTKLLSWQKWYLWQLPPMIVKGLTDAGGASRIIAAGLAAAVCLVSARNRQRHCAWPSCHYWRATIRASLSGTCLQTLPDLVTVTVWTKIKAHCEHGNIHQ